MTVIVGIAAEGNVIIGADSSASGDGHVFAIAQPKIMRWKLRSGDKSRTCVLGYTTSFRMGNIIQSMPLAGCDPQPGADAEDWLIHNFIPVARSGLADGGFMKKENNREQGGEFLIGTDGRLFIIQDDFSVIEPLDCVAAIGAGYQFAMGALVTTAKSAPMDRLRAALDAAERCSPFVIGPMNVTSLLGEGPSRLDEVRT